MLLQGNALSSTACCEAENAVAWVEGVGIMWCKWDDRPKIVRALRKSILAAGLKVLYSEHALGQP